MKPGPKPRAPEERFWAKVQKTDKCWLWTGGTGRRVYHNGQHIQVGTFDTIEEAAEAVRLKRIELFTHNDIDRELQ